MWEPASPQIWSLPFPRGLVTVADPGSLKTPHVRDRLLKKEHPLGVWGTTVRERECELGPPRLRLRWGNVRGAGQRMLSALREP